MGNCIVVYWCMVSGFFRREKQKFMFRRRRGERRSITTHVIFVSVLAIVIAIFSFFILDIYVSTALNNRLQNSGLVQIQEKRRIRRLQNYVKNYEVAATDNEAISVWVDRNQPLNIYIFRKHRELYDSDYPNQSAADYSENESSFSGNIKYQVIFADGEADVYITGFYMYRLYYSFIVAEIALSFLIFSIVMIFGLRKTEKNISRLRKEISILEGGGLEYPVTVTGNNEITDLAASVDEMRRSMKQQMENEKYLTMANQKMITSMSHDLRTPLTSIMLYTEILKSHRFQDEAQMWDYIDRIDQKAKQMKQLADNLFEYSLISSETEVELEPPAPFKVIFYDTLSEFASYLNDNGFTVEMNAEWPDRWISVNTNYLNRIMDNIASNILKYADSSEPVQCSVFESREAGILSFKNKNRTEGSGRDSSGVGLRNVRKMMEKMNGRSVATQDPDWFVLQLWFFDS